MKSNQENATVQNKVQNNEASAKSNLPAGNNPRKCGVRWWAWAAAAIMLVGAILRFCPSEPKSQGPVMPPDTPIKIPGNRANDSASDAAEDEARRKAEREAKREATRKAAMARLKKGIAERVERFEAEISSLLAHHHTDIRRLRGEAQLEIDNGINWAASGDGICSFRFCGGLAYSMAYDQFKGTNTAGEKLRPIIDSALTAPIQGFYDKCRARTEEHVRQVAEAEGRLRTDCDGIFYESILPDEIAAFDPGVLENAESAIITAIENSRSLAAKRAEAAVSATMEAVFISGTIKSIRAVALRLAATSLGKAVARMAGSAAAGAGCAVADGPLPIGDAVGAVIALGGSVWTAYDIYSALKTMPDKLRTDMRNGAQSALDSITKANIEQMDGFVDGVKLSVRNM